jgi:triacylglycerol lipase
MSRQSPPILPSAGKGKGREASLDSLIDDAMSTPLPPPVVASTFSSSSIPTPPRAHYPSSMTGLGRPRLVSQLTRSTLPTASLAYAPDGTRVVSTTEPPKRGESSTHRRSPSALMTTPIPTWTQALACL